MNRGATLRIWAPGLLLLGLVFGMPLLEPLFHAAFPALARPLYSRATFATLTAEHILLVLFASVPVVAAGIAAGIWVTRASGQAFSGMLDAVTAIGQTFPPSAVLAIAVPLVGYGAEPTVVALIAYGILPVVENTVAGLRSVSPTALDAAEGLGFTGWQRLTRIELPLAAPVILSGVRTSVIISIGTAAVGSTVGALTLGSPILEGLSGSNTAYVLQGALVVGLLAITTDQIFAWLDDRLRQNLG